MSRTRNQEYKYQYKTVAVANTFFCGIGPRLNVAVPDNLLDIKAIFMHAVLQFDASVPVGDRKILWAGGDYSQSIDGIPYPTEENMVFVNKQADATTRIADVKVDITHLKEVLMQLAPLTFDQPSMELNLITDVNGGFDVQGEVILWKVDFVYTTTGIQ